MELFIFQRLCQKTVLFLSIYMNRQRRYYIKHDGRHGKGNCSTLRVVEHVTVAVILEHARRGDLELWLLSPAGTASRLLGARPRDNSREGVEFIFLTRLSLGEIARGGWVFEVRFWASFLKGSSDFLLLGVVLVQGLIACLEPRLVGFDSPYARMSVGIKDKGITDR